MQDNGNGDGSSFRGKLLGFGPLQPWEFDAACNGVDQTIFFGVNRDSDERSKHSSRRTKFQTHVARIICKTCPVISECRTWLLEVDLPYGYAAGMTEAERKRERQRLGLTEPPGRPRSEVRPKAGNSPGVRNGSLRNSLPTMIGSIDRWSGFQGQGQQVGPKQ